MTRVFYNLTSQGGIIQQGVGSAPILASSTIKYYFEGTHLQTKLDAGRCWHAHAALLAQGHASAGRPHSKPGDSVQGIKYGQEPSDPSERMLCARVDRQPISRLAREITYTARGLCVIVL